MSRVFTGGRRPVVAAGTVGCSVSVIKVRGNPPGRSMTSHTVLGGGDVIPRLACRRTTVMTAAAGADHIGVIHPQCGYPGAIAVTILTHVVG